ncbi:MRG-domain-containing protein [Lyophyllum atratum]|nr:MRG-domain-containing protein [Lyophyllum atratum]
MSTSSSPPITFTPNERVLCYHGPLIYEAKVLKVADFTEETTITGAVGHHCFVHYKGWKQTWDEWVPHTRLLKHNEANIDVQKQLQRTNAPPPTGAGSSSRGPKAGMKEGGAGTRVGARKDGTRGTKRGREEDESSKKPDLRLNLPEILKTQLVDDWEAVTKNNQLVTIPRTPTVVELLDEFAAYITEKKPAHLRDPALLISSIVSGLIVYFDRSLGANLLYRFERPQYAEVRKKYKTGQQVIIGQEKEVSAVYGAEHLLRMLVSLPGMIASSSLDPESVALVRDYVNELLQWMVKERGRIFQAEYETASIPYQNVSRS